MKKTLWKLGLVLAVLVALFQKRAMKLAKTCDEKLKKAEDSITKLVKDNDDVLTNVETIKGTIEFKNLTFRYPDSDYDSLSNVSFVINQGENVGIIGKTGSGKTQIAELLRTACFRVIS